MIAEDITTSATSPIHNSNFELFNAGGDLALERDDVLGAHPGKRAFLVTVQVDEALESPLLAAREDPGPAATNYLCQ